MKSDFNFSLENIEQDLSWLLGEMTPRPAFSTKARLTALGIRDRLKEAGWEPKVAQLANNIVACRGEGHILYLAHSDTVQNTGGAIDNSVAVAALLELARSSQAADLCLGFPAQEELGMVGSRQMADVIAEWHPNPKALQTVVSLDLVGQGELSITGLNQNWSGSELSWLARNTDLHSEYGYQVVSRILPNRERSDHASFVQENRLTAQLLGRNADGIFPQYHQLGDTEYDLAHIENLMQNLEALAIAEPPSEAPNWQAGLLLGDIVLPFWLIWFVCLTAISLGFRSYISLKTHLLNLGKMFAVWLLWGIMSNIALFAPIFSSSMEEETAFNVTRLPANGWWEWGGIYFIILLATLKSLQIFHHKGKDEDACKKDTTGFWTGYPQFWGGLLTLFLVIIDPLLAFPIAIGTIVARFHPFLFAIGGLYWSSSSILRELSFWGLLPPTLWFLTSFLLLPALFIPAKR